jgi:hypothetical protein
MLHNALTVEEITALREKGLEPLDFAAMIGAAIPVQAQAVKDPGTGEHTIVLNLIVAIPERLLSIKFGGILDPHTKQTAMDSRMSKAFVTNPPPMFRLLVARDVLAASEQDRLRRLDVPSDVPLPTFTPRGES